MDELLRRFCGDERTRDAVLEWFHHCIDIEILDRVYSGKEIAGAKDARDFIDKAFDELKENYGVAEKPQPQTENRAR